MLLPEDDENLPLSGEVASRSDDGEGPVRCICRFPPRVPPVKRGNRSARRRSDFLNKKYNSLNYGQSRAEAIKIVWRHISLLRRKRTSRGSSYSSINSQPTA